MDKNDKALDEGSDGMHDQSLHLMADSIRHGGCYLEPRVVAVESALAETRQVIGGLQETVHTHVDVLSTGFGIYPETARRDAAERAKREQRLMGAVDAGLTIWKQIRTILVIFCFLAMAILLARNYGVVVGDIGALGGLVK